MTAQGRTTAAVGSSMLPWRVVLLVLALHAGASRGQGDGKMQRMPMRMHHFVFTFRSPEVLHLRVAVTGALVSKYYNVNHSALVWPAPNRTGLLRILWKDYCRLFSGFT